MHLTTRSSKNGDVLITEAKVMKVEEVKIKKKKWRTKEAKYVKESASPTREQQLRPRK
jgi:hypothetical protein